MKTPEPGARRYFFIPSPDGARWDLAEATYRRRAWEVAYPGHSRPDRFESLPPKDADWVELVPPGRAPRRPWPPRPKLARLADEAADAPPEAPVPPPPPRHAAPAPRAPAAKGVKRAPTVAKKAIPGLSRELEGLLRDELRSQKVPPGKAQCPACGLVLEPTRNGRVRTHDDPLGGARCAASGRRWAEFEKDRPPRPGRA